MSLSSTNKSTDYEDITIRSPVKISFEDFLEILQKPYTGLRYELDRGFLVVKSTPSTYHQSIASYLKYLLQSNSVPLNLGKVIGEITIKLSDEDTILPDIIYLAKSELNLQKKQYIDCCPSLIIEITSPSSMKKDYLKNRKKAQDYLVKEYWVINQDEELIDVFHLKGDKYDYKVFKSKNNDILKSGLEDFKDFKLSVKEFFDYAKK